MTRVDGILMFCCMSAFFAGLVIAAATLPVNQGARFTAAHARFLELSQSGERRVQAA